MNDYDFLILSANEFENLTRDLLQKKLGIFIETFTTGKDGGIDLRCSENKSKKIIIQAKRYDKYSTLLSNLKQETKKVEALNPDRYIVSTTVGLTPKNKEEILKLFSPYILQTEDILGKDDLNNLLSLNKDIESKHYKLWLPSINILEKFLHSKIHNQSTFELEQIKEKIKLYVQNDSFNKGIKILEEHKYVIISGIPGIGKTTLARALILYLLGKGFNEFVYLNDSISEGYEYYKEEKKQIFFFDDFLGKNVFEGSHKPNLDKNLVTFIEKIKKSPNKLFILTTREYILNQAKSSFEAFKINNIEIAKCTIDIETYTNIIKAKILYNHLFFANIPENYLKCFIDSNKYFEIVKHQNYNPRIIETLINRKVWESCEALDFSDVMKSYFDNPESVWLTAYEKSLDKLSQYALLVLLTMGTPVKMDDLKKALISFLNINQYKYQCVFDTILFDRSIRELENTFIKTQKDIYNVVVINYQNPSIQDFLVNYLREKEDLIIDLIKSAIFQEQFFYIFSNNIEQANKLKKSIFLNKNIKENIFENIKEKYEILKSCRTFMDKFSESEKFIWRINNSTQYQFLNTFFLLLKDNLGNIFNFIKSKFEQLIYFQGASDSEQSSYINLLSNFKQHIQFNKKTLIFSFLNNMLGLDDLEYFSKLEKYFPNNYQSVIENELFSEKIEAFIEAEIDIANDEYIFDLKEKIESIESEYNLDLSVFMNELNEKINDYENYVESQIEEMDWLEYGKESRHTSLDENDIIKEIFESLKNS